MSISVIKKVMETKRFKGADRTVLIALAFYADHDGTRVFPTVAEVMARTSLSERQVRASMRNLQEDGVLRLIRKSSRAGDPNEYQVLLEAVPDDADRGAICAGVRGADFADTPAEIAPVGVQDLHPRGADNDMTPLVTVKKTVRVQQSPQQPIIAAVPKDAVDLAIQLYNEVAKQCPERTGMVICRDKTPARATAIKARLAKYGQEGWRKAMEKALASDFISGRSPRGRGHENFRVNIDWIAKQGNFAKLMEGSYDGNQRERGPRHMEEAVGGLMDWLERQGGKA